ADVCSSDLVLEKTESGKKFRELLLGSIYPVLMDSRRNLLSFPPVINAEYTRIKGGVKNLLVEVTGVDKTTVDKVLANIAATLADIGFSLETVSINQDRNTTTSFNSMENTRLDNIKTDYINKKLGL